MKNKLTTEEQLLQSKLNEVQFNYQEADWAQMEAVVAKKGFWGNYGMLFKTAAIFAILGAAVFLVNEQFESRKTTNQDNPVASDLAESNKVTTSIIDSETNQSNLDQEVIKTDNTLLAESSEIKETTEAPSNVISKLPTNEISKNTNIKTETINVDIVPAETKPSASKEWVNPHFEIKGVQILNAPCINSTVHFDLSVRGFYDDEIEITWMLNNKILDGKKAENQALINVTGDYTIKAIAQRDNQVLSSSESHFIVEDIAPLNFVYHNLSTPFDDDQINLSITNPIQGTYVWFADGNKKKLTPGTNVNLELKTEGMHDVTVEYTSNYGCTQSTTKQVEMEKFYSPLVFPNAFTPYNGGYNEVFELSVLKPYTYKNYELVIQDMNGRVAFKTINAQDNWNGKLNNTGETLKGKFAWVVKLENENGKRKSFSGKVEIR